MIAVAAMAASVFATAPAWNVYADDVVEEGETLIENEGNVSTNNGTICNNYGDIGTNATTGEIVNNFSGGEVGVNEGTIDYNREGATVTANEGTVNVNSGEVTNVSDDATVQINDGGTVDGTDGSGVVNLGGTVNGDVEVGYNLGDAIVESAANIINRMWEIIPKSVGDWEKILVSGTNMCTFDDATMENAATAGSLKQTDLDGTVMSVWVSETNDGTIYLAPTGNTRTIKDLTATSGSGSNAVITKLDDGRWCISRVTGNVILTYILEETESESGNEDDQSNDDYPVLSVVKHVAEWTLSEDNKIITVAKADSQYELKELKDPAIKSALYDFLIKSLSGTVDVSKAKVINSLTVSLKEPKVITVPAGISTLTANSNVYVVCTDLETGEMRYVKATVESDSTISFAVPFRKCAFSIVIFD